MYAGGVRLVHAVAPGVAGQDGVFIENPHPQLVYHNGARNLADFRSADIAAVAVLVFRVVLPAPPAHAACAVMLVPLIVTWRMSSCCVLALAGAVSTTCAVAKQ